MARPSSTANLSSDELFEVETIMRSTRVEYHIKERDGIILDWHEGKSYDESQVLLKASRLVVAK